MAKKRKPEPPIVTNPRIVIFGEIVVDEGTKCVFQPWMSRDHNVLGWDAQPSDVSAGRTYIYIAPDTDSGGSGPQFNLFIGPHGDPTRDRMLGPYRLDEDG